MPWYEVTLRITGTATAKIEAKNPDDAEEQAMEADNLSVEDIDEQEVFDVTEIKG
jgi:hypothetical protein